MLPERSQVRAGLLGFGNVGRAFVHYLRSVEAANYPTIKICAVADRSGGLLLNDAVAVDRLLAHKESGQNIAHFSPLDTIQDCPEFVSALRGAGISYLIESLPTNIADGQPALELITRALEQGLHVVTVDKGPLVHGFGELQAAAQRSGARFGFSGTTGVSIPDELRGDRVLEIRGVLNGTTNHILSEMQGSAIPFDRALASAQAQGIAEPDPKLDVEGWDTASKILILAKTLMGAQCGLAEVSRIGIGPETESLIRIGCDSGRVVRLVGRARIWQERVRVSVAPKLVERDSPFYSVSGTSKAALFRTERQGIVLSQARSGRDAISQIILDDIAKIANSVAG